MLRNIVLTGFMGTGKTTIGQRLARVMGFDFVDMDKLLEKREGRTIRKIFETEGETYFRRLEGRLCRELSRWRNCVIATGGGALVDLRNLTVYRRRNLVVCLDCEPEMLWQRLKTAENRPMLDAADRKARLLALLAERQPAYGLIEHHIDTTDQQVRQTVEALIALWQQYR